MGFRPSDLPTKNPATGPIITAQLIMIEATTFTGLGTILKTCWSFIEIVLSYSIRRITLAKGETADRSTRKAQPRRRTIQTALAWSEGEEQQPRYSRTAM